MKIRVLSFIIVVEYTISLVTIKYPNVKRFTGISNRREKKNKHAVIIESVDDSISPNLLMEGYPDTRRFELTIL